jgi:hypothetical protein
MIRQNMLISVGTPALAPVFVSIILARRRQPEPGTSRGPPRHIRRLDPARRAGSRPPRRSAARGQRA